MEKAYVVRGQIADGRYIQMQEPVDGAQGEVEVVVRMVGARRASESSAAAFEPAAADFWREPSLEELAADQGLSLPQAFDQLVGEGAELWANDDDFRAFVTEVRASSRERPRGP